MDKWIGFEVVAMGKMDDYKAWWEARDKRLQELGMARVKLYQVNARTQNMVFFEYAPMTMEEAQHWLAQYQADEAIRELQRERTEKNVVRDGTTEFFWMTEA